MKSIGRHLSRFRSFLQDKTGVSAVEYALIVVAVVGIVGVGIATLSEEFQAIFDQAELSLTEAKDEVQDLIVT